MRAGLYVHFPFCRAKCPYCHFASVPHCRDKHREWREGLEAEAALRADPGLGPDTLYIGGVTPSLMSPGEISDILKLLQARLEPDHVSLYILENVEGLPFEKVMDASPVDEDEVLASHDLMRAGSRPRSAN